MLLAQCLNSEAEVGEGIDVPLNLHKASDINWDAAITRKLNSEESYFLYNELAVRSVEVVLLLQD